MVHLDAWVVGLNLPVMLRESGSGSQGDKNTSRDKITKAKSVGINLRILEPTDTLQQKWTLDVCTAAPALQIFLVFLPIILSNKIWAKGVKIQKNHLLEAQPGVVF